MEDEVLRRVECLEAEIATIKERNVKVEADKAWETSWFRVALLVVTTYTITAVVFYFIGVNSYLLSALIPTVGYILSTQSLPFIKKWWLSKCGS
ncbi:hypothetical protein OAO01_00280 [Oligoflexia bacterium]|nr:hypothetical protein [Oligoflexia bacterium]